MKIWIIILIIIGILLLITGIGIGIYFLLRNRGPPPPPIDTDDLIGINLALLGIAYEGILPFNKNTPVSYSLDKFTNQFKINYPSNLSPIIYQNYKIEISYQNPPIFIVKIETPKSIYTYNWNSKTQTATPTSNNLTPIIYNLTNIFNQNSQDSSIKYTQISTNILNNKLIQCLSSSNAELKEITLCINSDTCPPCK